MRARAARIAAALGAGFVAVHVRLRDRGAQGLGSKGLNRSQLPAALRRLAPLLREARRAGGGGAAAAVARQPGQPPGSCSGGGVSGGGGGGLAPAEEQLTVYVATNRPGALRELRPALEAALAAELGRGARLRGWHDVAAAEGGGLRGLRAALVEHELCAREAACFAGSQWSTWSNLIGARRWALGQPASCAYLDMDSGLPAPACARTSGEWLHSGCTRLGS